jgi:hypothetical protein
LHLSPYNGFQSGLYLIYSAFVLRDNGPFLDPHLLAHIYLLRNLLLLPLNSLFKDADLLVLVKLSQLVLEHARVRPLPLPPADLLVSGDVLLKSLSESCPVRIKSAGYASEQVLRMRRPLINLSSVLSSQLSPFGPIDLLDLSYAVGRLATESIGIRGGGWWCSRVRLLLIKDFEDGGLVKHGRVEACEG